MSVAAWSNEYIIYSFIMLYYLSLSLYLSLYFTTSTVNFLIPYLYMYIVIAALMINRSCITIIYLAFESL